jgi:uncharacterized protein (TIGR02145 family)
MKHKRFTLLNSTKSVQNNLTGLKLSALFLLGLGLTGLQAQSVNTFTDSRDGNVYQTVTIGTQVWMAENLKYLPDVTEPGTGSQTQTYYYVYGYDGTKVTDAKATENYKTYGVLYNWPAAMTGATSSTANPSNVQGICPDGWHLPSDAEWKQLIDHLEGSNKAGAKLKESGTTNWNKPNAGTTNQSGFTALPGGNRGSYGSFGLLGDAGYWWSATEGSSSSALYQDINCNNSHVYRQNASKDLGLSVRCLRD